jgi:hypothetical protein
MLIRRQSHIDIRSTLGYDNRAFGRVAEWQTLGT